jgi:hypothetical protein
MGSAHVPADVSRSTTSTQTALPGGEGKPPRASPRLIALLRVLTLLGKTAGGAEIT